MGKRLVGRRQAFFWCVFRSCFVKRCRNNAAARTAGPRLNKKTVGEVPRSFFLSAASTSVFFVSPQFIHRLALTRSARAEAGPYLSGKEWFIVGFQSSIWWIAVHRENHCQQPIHHLSIVSLRNRKKI